MPTSIDILNTIWANASDEYQNRIPQATRDNIAEVGNALLAYEPAMNEFLNALVNRIGMVLISSKLAKNKLSLFKKGKLEYGSDIEEIFVEMAKAESFNVELAESTVFKRTKPDVKTLFHRVNREDVYPITIERAHIKRAFLSSDGVARLVSAIINSVYSADNYDEYVLMKDAIGKYFAETSTVDSQYTSIPIVKDKESAMHFLRVVKQASEDMTFMSNKFNAQGVMQYTDKQDQVLLVHKNLVTYLDVDVLAWAFNDKKLDVNTRVITVDDFGTTENIQAILCDKNWLMVYDVLFEMTNQYNAKGLYYNYFLHHHQLISTSQFHNAIAIKVAEE